MAGQANIHGRKWGRGVRPWLLIPKYVCVSLILGGLGAVVMVDLAARAMGETEEQQREAAKLIGAVFVYQIVPATVAAIVLGVLLLLQHPGVFLRMRWMVTKLALIAVVTPVSHVALRHEVGLMRVSPPARVGLLAGMSLAGFGVIAVVGRLKPRLGQRVRGNN